MTKRMLKQVKKPKTPSNRRVKSFDEKHYGSEPIIIGELKNSQLSDALNWYNYMIEIKIGRKWLEEFLKNEQRLNDLAVVENTDDCWISMAMCSHARMRTNGTIFSVRDTEWFDEKIKYLYSKQKVKQPKDQSDKSSISIQDRVRKKNESLCSSVEEMIDLGEVDVYNFLLKNEATPSAATYICDFYQPMYDETMLDDPDVKESYGKKLKYWQELYKKIVDDCQQYIGNKKAVKVKKPRTIKVKPITKIVEKLNYQKEFGPLRLVSISPTEIVGATQLWVYNSKTRILGVYNTSEGATLSVKGSTIINWDEKKSQAKRLRKPEEVIPGFLKAGKVILRTYLDDIKTTKQEVNGRINKDTILLRIQR